MVLNGAREQVKHCHSNSNAIFHLVEDNAVVGIMRIVIKGCSKKPVPVAAYVYLTDRLKPLVKSLMYGEPCSTVPVYKKK
jgi:hypothetical protein